MKVVSGTLLGTGADIHVCLGFTPDFVRLFRTETTLGVIEYHRLNNTASAGGITRGSGDADAAVIAASGIRPLSTATTADGTTHLVHTPDGTYTFEAETAGKPVPQGFTIDSLVALNAAGAKLVFEAGVYDAL